MTATLFSDEDLRQIQSHGLTLEQVQQQLRFFSHPPAPVRLLRPATVGDGIRRLAAATFPGYLRKHAEACAAGRFQKFVPASGSASRMFEVLLYYYHCREGELARAVDEDLRQNLPRARQFCTFFQNLPRLAFFPELQKVLAREGQVLEDLLHRQRHRDILRYLLTDAGLNYQALPKALIKFHAYGEESRTALEEHLVEAAAYIRDRTGLCRLHFTIQPHHRRAFDKLLAEVRPDLERRYDCRFEVNFSSQRSSTDTIAADADNLPFRDRQGRLVFRPGGHGALLENLNELQGDLVYIKNIDNVVPDRLKAPTITWKKLLGGVLVALQEEVHEHLRALTSGRERNRTLQTAADFLGERLGLPLPDRFATWPEERQREFLLRMLNRPLRVCGVVRNQGEPGGAPFWVEAPDGTVSLQLVEQVQVDLAHPGQRAIWESATHFNPVDLVCALRDDQGIPFDLTQYVDREAVFISRKTQEGRELKALELPGLWNGGMARWLTVFVEVPLITFNPVKTVFDLLRPEHLPEDPVPL